MFQTLLLTFIYELLTPQKLTLYNMIHQTMVSLLKAVVLGGQVY